MLCAVCCRCAHFAIYDGHGGRLAADFAQKHLHQNVIAAGLPRELVCLQLYIFLLLFSVSISCYDVPLLYLVSLMADLFAKFSLLMNTKFLLCLHIFFSKRLRHHGFLNLSRCIN